MKKSNGIKLCLLGVAILVVSACTKEDVVKDVNETTQSVNKSAKISYYLNGEEEIILESFNKTNNSSFVSVDSNVIYVFENDEKLMSWANKSSSNARTSEIANGVIEKMEELNTLHNEIKKRGIEDDTVAIDLLVKEMYKTTNARIAVAVGLNIAFDGENLDGAILIVGGVRRSLGGWNDRISSIAAIGVNIYCEDSNWKGAKYITVAGDIRLGILGWSNRISSYL